MASIHPIIVNFAIILLGTGIAAEILGLVIKAEKIRRVATSLLWSGVLSALIAVLSGNDAYHHLSNPQWVEGVVDQHKLFGQLTLLSGILMLILRQWSLRGDRRVKIAFIFMLVLTASMLFQTATLGGEMEHRLHPHQQAPSKIEKPSFQ